MDQINWLLSIRIYIITTYETLLDIIRKIQFYINNYDCLIDSFYVLQINVSFEDIFVQFWTFGRKKSTFRARLSDRVSSPEDGS